MIYNSLTGSGRKSLGTPLVPLVCFSALAIINRGLSLLLLPIYLRHISPAEYGVLAAVTIVAAVIAVVSNLKLDAAMRTFYFDYYDGAPFFYAGGAGLDQPSGRCRTMRPLST